MARILEEIKIFWPDMSVTKENLQKPTPEFVMQVYNRFVTDIEEHISDALGCYQDDLRRDLEPEEVIFLKMQKFNPIFKQPNIKFMMGDIYDPQPAKTKKILKICLHYLNYFETIFPSLKNHIRDVIGMREDQARLADGKEQLLVEINEFAMLKSQLLQENEQLKKELEKIEADKKGYDEKRSNLEREIQNQQKELEILQRKAEEKEHVIEKLEAQEKRLEKETVSDEEYIDLKNLIDSLEAEKKSLQNEDVNLDELLTDENKMLNHLRDCRKAIPAENFKTDLVNRLVAIEQEIEDLKSEKNKFDSILSSAKSTHNQQKGILEENKNALIHSKLANEKVKQQIEGEKVDLSKDLFKQKEEIKETLKQLLAEKQYLNTKISQLESDSEKLKENFKEEYVKVAKAQNGLFITVRANWRKLIQKWPS